MANLEKQERARTVMEHADEATKEAVKQGELSINRAYQETQKKRKQTEAESSTDNTDEQSASVIPEKLDPADRPA